MLVGSANDAAIVLARQDENGVSGFVKKMNKKAEELNLENTHFTNPIGLDHEAHKTTAHDLVILTDTALENNLFKELVGVRRVIFSSQNKDDAEKRYDLENINELLGSVKGLKGVKTGWTSLAGECLVSWTERADRDILVAVLGSRDRFGETKLLTEWVFDNFYWEEYSNANL
jgi:D-alanyl-D-alanine carboxypeptidase